MPACHMKIYSNDKLAENVKIGDPLKMMINIDKQDSFGLHITDCLVRDGIGWGEQKLIDSHGCPLDQEIVGPFSYDSDRTKATVAFPAHKFPYTTSVYYQCNVRLCSIEEDGCHKVRTRILNVRELLRINSRSHSRRLCVTARRERSERQTRKRAIPPPSRSSPGSTSMKTQRCSTTISTLSSKRRWLINSVN